jgi:hypothetical protein
MAQQKLGSSLKTLPRLRHSDLPDRERPPSVSGARRRTG